jgi:hypothetical protein
MPQRTTRHSTPTGRSLRDNGAAETQEWDEERMTGKINLPVPTAKSLRDVVIDVTPHAVELTVGASCTMIPFPTTHLVDFAGAKTKWDAKNKVVTVFCKYTLTTARMR